MSNLDHPAEKVETVKVKPWGKGQGEFVEINKTDFDPKKHELFDAKEGDEDGDGKIDAKELEALREKVKASGKTVSKNGKQGKASKWLVLGADFKPVDDKEFKTEVEALQHAVAVPAAS